MSDIEPIVENSDTVTVETGWKNPPTLAKIKEDMANVVENQSKHIENIDRWLDLLYVRGTAKIKKKSGRSNVQPKLIRKQLEWRIPSLTAPFLSTEELFNVTPRTAEDRWAAKQNQLLLNYQFNTVIDKVNFIDSYVRSVSSEGTVFLRIGWEYEVEMKDVENVLYEYPEANQGDLFVLQQAMQLQQSDPAKFKALVPEAVKHSLDISAQLGKPVMAVDTGEVEVVQEEVVIKNQPTIDVVDYRRLYVDPNAMGNLDKADFIVYAFDTTLSELRNDDNYSNLDVIDLGSSEAASLTDAQIQAGINFNYSDDSLKRVTAYEYWGNWDIEGTGIVEPVLITWVGNTIIRMEKNPFPDKKHPFVNTVYTPVKDSIYGEPDAEILEENQAIYGATMRSMIDILGKTANGQKGIRQDMLDPLNRRKYERGDDFEYNPMVDARQGIANFTSPEVPQSAQYMLQLQNNEAESMSGVKSYGSGIGSQALGDVAAGIKGALDATSKRDLSILNRLANGLIKAARKVMALNSEYLSDEEVVRVTDDEFVEIRKDDLFGNFDLKLSISTAEEDENKANRLEFMLQTLGNSVPFEVTKLILEDIATLRKMPTLAKKLSNYQPQPNPNAELREQLELQLLQAQIANEQSKSVEARAEAILKSSKAGNLDADTRQKILDFVEQETGVSQERAKELHQSQAEGNMKLELIKSALNNTQPQSQPTERVEPQDTGANNEPTRNPTA